MLEADAQGVTVASYMLAALTAVGERLPSVAKPNKNIYLALSYA